MSRNYVMRTKRIAFDREVSNGKAQTLRQVIYKPAFVSFGEAGMSHCVVLASRALTEIHLLLPPKERHVSPHQPLIGPKVAPWLCQLLIFVVR